MIKINLLPQEMVGAKGGASAGSAPSPASGKLLVAAALIALVAVDAVLGFYLYTAQASAKAELEELEDRATEIAQELEETEVTYNQETADIELMNDLISVYESLDSDDRILWSEKLNMLPLLVPENIYLSDIQVTQQIREIETEDSVKARNAWQEKKASERSAEPPAAEMVPVITQSMRLVGICYVEGGSGPQRLTQISRFYQNLQGAKSVVLPFDKQERRFVTGFDPNIRLEPINVTTINDREVSTFNFTMRTKPIRIE